MPLQFITKLHGANKRVHAGTCGYMPLHFITKLQNAHMRVHAGTRPHRLCRHGKHAGTDWPFAARPPGRALARPVTVTHPPQTFFKNFFDC